MEINNNIPNYNFITSLIREKNNNIKENILLGNIHFPEMLLYSPKSLLESESHAIFLNKLSNKLSLEKIKEEKNFLNKKIEMTNNKIDNIKNYINRETVKRNYNDLLPPLNFSNILPIIKEKKEKNKKSKEKFNKNKLLMEIKPLPSKRGNQVLIDKRLNKEKEYDLEQNAKEFIRKINNYKINNINIRKQKQKLDFLRLQKEIEIAERKKQKEEYELIQKREELKQNFLKKQNLFNNYNNEMSPQKIKRKRYHYYNNPQNSSRKNRNKMMKNFSYVFHHNNNNYNYNYQFYNNINNINAIKEETKRQLDYCLIFYDMNNESTMDYAKNIFETYFKSELENVSNISLSHVIFIGNKCDLNNNVNSKIEELCKEFKMDHFEISVKDNICLEEMKNKLTQAFDNDEFQNRK